MPGVYVNVLAGVGAAQITELEGSAAFLSRLPAYAAHFSRSGIGPEQTWIAARQLSELPALLEPWRDTVDEVVLIPVSAEGPGPPATWWTPPSRRSSPARSGAARTRSYAEPDRGPARDHRSQAPHRPTIRT